MNIDKQITPSMEMGQSLEYFKIPALTVLGAVATSVVAFTAYAVGNLVDLYKKNN